MIESELKRALGQMTYGVQVVACEQDGEVRGYTSTWVCQVSFEEPIVAASISPKHDTFELIASRGWFTVSLLAGDQIEEGWVRINGIAYEPKEDVLYIYSEAGGGVDHAISKPREIFVELAEPGIKQVVVMDADDHKQFIRLRAPLALPASTEMPREQPAASMGR